VGEVEGGGGDLGCHAHVTEEALVCGPEAAPQHAVLFGRVLISGSRLPEHEHANFDLTWWGTSLKHDYASA